MASVDDEDQGGGSSKRRMDSPVAGNERKKMAPDKIKKLRMVLDEVYCGVVLNEFVQQSIKDACKEMKSIVEEMIAKEDGKDTNCVDLSSELIADLMNESMVVHWVLKEDATYGEIIEALPAIKGISEESLNQNGGVLVQREEVVMIEGTTANTQPVKKCLLMCGTEWPGAQETLSRDISAVMERMNKEKVAGFTIIIPNSWNLNSVRRELNQAINSTNLKCKLRGDPEQTRKLATNPARSWQPDTVINVPLGKKTYAEALSELKEKVTPKECGVQILRTAPRAGIVKVFVRGEQKENAKKLVEDINLKTAAGASIERKTRGVFIYNMEDDVEEDEVITELSRILQVGELECKVVFRENPNGRAALAILDSNLANRLARVQFVRRSGWTNWVMKLKMNPKFCVKCQLFGHSPRECKNDDAPSARCMRCGVCGHLQKTCTDPEYCPCCKTSHRMNSMACPVFRRLVDLERTQSVF